MPSEFSSTSLIAGLMTPTTSLLPRYFNIDLFVFIKKMKSRWQWSKLLSILFNSFKIGWLGGNSSIRFSMQFFLTRASYYSPQFKLFTNSIFASSLRPIILSSTPRLKNIFCSKTSKGITYASDLRFYSELKSSSCPINLDSCCLLILLIISSAKSSSLPAVTCLRLI